MLLKTNVKVLNLMSRTMKQDTQDSMKLVNANVDQMQIFVIVNSVEIITNTDVNAKNWLRKKYVIKDLFGI